uniref:C2H2-type domain-containing protein n=1 Tax=Panagrellus redivivus TaxID=6233 RepID=A0A7E4V544_PANRE
MKPEPRDVVEDSALICLWAHCFQSFNGLTNLVRHVDEHVEDIQNDIKLSNLVPEFHCRWQACKRTKPFDVKYKLLKHMGAHTDYRPYVCDFPDCERAFRRCENLKSHRRGHTNSKPYECQLCEKSFASASDRAKHLSRVHTEGKTCVCRVVDCPKAYNDPSSLRKHIKNIHGPNVHECFQKINAVEKAGGDIQFIFMEQGPNVKAKAEDKVELVSYDQIKDRIDRVKLDEKRAEIQLAVSSKKALTETINERKAVNTKPKKEKSLRKTVLKRGRKSRIASETEESTPGPSRERSFDSTDTSNFSTGSPYSSDYYSNEPSPSHDPSEGHRGLESGYYGTTNFATPEIDRPLLSSEEEDRIFNSYIGPQLDSGAVTVDSDFDFDLLMGSDEFDTEPVQHQPYEFNHHQAYYATDAEMENLAERNRNDPMLCDIYAPERWTDESPFDDEADDDIWRPVCRDCRWVTLAPLGPTLQGILCNIMLIRLRPIKGGGDRK